MNLQGHGWQAAAIAACARAAGVDIAFTEATEMAVTLPTGTVVQFEEAINYFAGKQDPAENAGAVRTARGNRSSSRDSTLALFSQLTQNVELATSIAADDSATSAMGDNASLLVTLANMGVQHNSVQKTARDAFAPSATLAAALSTIEGALTSTPFLSGAAPGISDFVVAAALYRGAAVLGAATVLAAAPAAQTWLNTVAVQHLSPAFEVVGASLGGWTRIGGQVDRRPSPVRTAAAADAAIELNKSYKKKENQRQKERAAKKAEIAAAAAASSAKGNAASGGAPAAAAGGGASHPFGVQPTATQRAENEQGVPSLQDGITRATSALNEWGITHTGPFEHKPAVDVATLLDVSASFGGVAVKNLFVKAKKPKGEGDSRMWLVVLRHDTTLNMKDLATQLGYGKITIRFGDAKSLLANLGTAQGHVSPFALMNDTKLDVQVALDEAIVQAGADETFLVHPFVNEACVGVKGGDMGALVQRTGHNFVTVKGE